MPEIKNMTIDRADWGKGSLLKANGQMCCLGHLGAACGVSFQSLLPNGFPHHIDNNERFKYPKKFAKNRWNVNNLAADINDCHTMKIAEKESRIRLLFAGHGIKVKFVGDRRKAGV